MRTIIFFILIIGIFMIVHGIYEEKYDRLKKDVRIKYKFIPRTFYDEFLFNQNFSSQYSNLFETSQSDTRSAGLPER